MSDTVLAGKARAWNRARLFELALKELRNSFACECWEPDEVETGYRGVDVCWRRLEWDSQHEPQNPHEWCASCRRRQAVHLAVQAAGRVRAGRLRALQYAAGKTLTPPPPHPLDPETQP